MKKTIILSILVVFLLTLWSCGNKNTDLTCEQIIEAYENAGYTNIYHKHGSYDTNNLECYIIIYRDSTDSSDLAEIKIYPTEEDAENAQSVDNYNVVKWFVAAMLGEGRWLEVGRIGKIEYSSYNSNLLEPLKNLS